ncbi:MAG TPA: RecQ family zinc-binding domain-containing protein, partial [Planctomycetota bacterium]|nr:RecQ family zinc-binding domain-containing protein [Planctomycetota bacterium]
LRMVRYASEPECRKRTIHAHFGFDDLADGCGACDLCVATDGWLATHLPAPRPLRRGDQAPGTDRLQRGDWIDVQDLGLCAVLSVHELGESFRADVETASDLNKHTVDLRRVKWRRVRHEA